MINALPIAEKLTARFGVPLEGQAFDDRDGQHVRLRPSELSRTQGFSLEVVVKWRTLEVHVTPDSFAVTLLKTMQDSEPSQRAAFIAFIQSVKRDGGIVSFAVNDAPVDPLNPGVWPPTWRSLELSVRKSPISIDSTTETENLVLSWSSRIIGAMFALIPLEPCHEGQTEGEAKQVIVTRYERSSVNRAACIEINGSSCSICGFDFGDVYDQIGEGFIEVHHINPVSAMVPGATVDPATDLIPVCSNCHSMLHRIMPPYNPDQLRAFLQVKKTGFRSNPPGLAE